MAFRNFLIPSTCKGRPLLVTAQATYRNMYLQAQGPDMAPLWSHDVIRPPGDPRRGPAGSHMTPVVDLFGTGRNHLLWGERCLDLHAGRERWCGARESYQGHSDVIQPFLDRAGGQWRIHTCRESDPEATPRVVVYDDRGDVLWGAVGHGHMDMGWVAHVTRDGDHDHILACAMRLGAKTCGPDGREHMDREHFLFEALTGDPLPVPFDPYRTLPVDLDGDGFHAAPP